MQLCQLTVGKVQCNYSSIQSLPEGMTQSNQTSGMKSNANSFPMMDISICQSVAVTCHHVAQSFNILPWYPSQLLSGRAEIRELVKKKKKLRLNASQFYTLGFFQPLYSHVYFYLCSLMNAFVCLFVSASVLSHLRQRHLNVARVSHCHKDKWTHQSTVYLYIPCLFTTHFNYLLPPLAECCLSTD